jgi:ABC-type dipeptide/oligopeptide/nickel transport system permease component
VTRYIVRRVGAGVVVVFLAATIGFLLTNAIGDPADLLVGGSYDPQAIADYRASLGLDQPLGERYLDYVTGLATGDFGESFRFGGPAMGIVLDALPYTLLLIGAAVLLALAFSIPAAVMAVARRNSRTDRVTQRLMMVLQGIPEFWLGLMLALIFGEVVGLLPTIGYAGVETLVLPACTLAVALLPTFTRLLRGQLLDIMQQDFVDALRAKGLSEVTIVRRHGLRNVMGTFVTVLALQFGWLLGGTILIEVVFAWPGIGFTALSAVQARDLTVLQSLIVLIAVCFVLFNLLADLFVIWADPRVRVQGA